MRIKKLLFLIPVVALLTVVLFAVGSPSEAFADVPSLSLGDSFEVEYGDFILNEAQWVYDSTNDVFVSYGNIEAGAFTPTSTISSNSNGEYYQYKCRLNLYIVDPNGELEAQSGSNKFSKPYDKNGLCNVAPNKTYTIGAGYTKQKGAFATLTAINSSGEETAEVIYLERYSSQILTVKVKQRTITVDVDLANSFGFVSSVENDTLSLSRTYSINSALKLVISEGNNLVFNHQFSDFTFNAYENVGEYPEFIFTNDNIKIMLGETDVTSYYKVSSKYKIKLTINKLIIVAPTYDFESIYKQDCILKENLVIDGDNVSVPISDYDLINFKSGSNNSEMFGNENLIHYFYDGTVYKNSDLQVEYSYSINTTLDALFPMLSDDVSVYSLYVADNYTCSPILNKVIYNNEILDNSNFEIRQDNLSTFKIDKKTIMLYAENTEISIEPQDGVSLIAVSTDAFSHPYGKAYSERSTTTVRIDTNGDDVLDSDITIPFRIKEFQTYLANPNFYNIDGKVILNKGEYAIDPETIEDFRYNATIHESLHYTVTAKELLLSDLLSANEFINTVDVVDGLYVINSYAYGTPSSDYSTVDLSFAKRLPEEIGENDSMLPDPITFSVRFAFDIKFNHDSLNNVTPGIYRATSIVADNYNYLFADLTVDGQMVVAIRINKKELTVTLGDKEYDGETVTPIIEGDIEGNAYEVNVEYSNGTSFRTAITSLPINIGTYTARITLVDGSIYAFANNSNYIDVTFNIKKRAIIVRVESKGTKTFGTEGYFKNPTNSNIATYTVRHATDSTKTGLIGNDSLGSLFSPAAAQGAKPGVYNIETKNIKNANYDIKFEYPNNAKTATIEVTKLKQVTTDIKFTARQANPKTTGQTITVSEFTLWGNVIPVVITYKINGEFTDANVEKVGGGYQISSLLEGTNYEIRYTIPKNNDYLDLGQDYILLDLSVSTDLTAPDWYQAMDKLYTDNVIIHVKNYQADNYFATIQNDGVFEYGLNFDIPLECITLVYNTDDAAVVDYAIFDLGKAISLSSENVDNLTMTANTTFTIRVSRRTDDKELDISKVQSREIYTIAAKPDIKKKDIAFDSTSITLTQLPELSDGSKYVLSYIKGEHGKSTISSLVDSDVDLTEVFNNSENEIVYSDNLMINSIEADTIYYIRIYVVKEIDEMVSPDGTTINSVAGKPIYFELYTPKAQKEAPTTNFLLKISGYIGIGTMGVLAVLLIILGIIYAMLRRKWRIR